MANEIANAAAPQLPAALANIKAAVAKTVAKLPSASAGGFLSFAKYGAWELGKDRETVTDEDHAAVNVLGIKTGYICWPEDEKLRKNGPLATVAAPLGQTVDVTTLDRSLPGNWVDYVEMPVRFTGGELDGEEATYNSNSKGGVDAVRGLLDKVTGRLDGGHSSFIPVVSLQVDSYPHKTYGKIFFPVLDIVDWIDMDGNGAEGEAPAQIEKAAAAAPDEPEAAPAAGGRRRRRS